MEEAALAVGIIPTRLMRGEDVFGGMPALLFSLLT
jgi:hypothetical protein